MEETHNQKGCRNILINKLLFILEFIFTILFEFYKLLEETLLVSLPFVAD
jgi:hypothetical protein